MCFATRQYISSFLASRFMTFPRSHPHICHNRRRTTRTTWGVFVPRSRTRPVCLSRVHGRSSTREGASVCAGRWRRIYHCDLIASVAGSFRSSRLPPRKTGERRRQQPRRPPRRAGEARRGQQRATTRTTTTTWAGRRRQRRPARDGKKDSAPRVRSRWTDAQSHRRLFHRVVYSRARTLDECTRNRYMWMVSMDFLQSMGRPIEALLTWFSIGARMCRAGQYVPWYGAMHKRPLWNTRLDFMCTDER